MNGNKQKPNIIVYFVDQQRWDTVGVYGQPLDITPHLDQMAKEGTQFEYAFTCQPVCGPARACLQTGKYATQVGCHVNGISLPLDEKTVPRYLDAVGYDTAYVGKWHLASDRNANHYETIAIPEERRGGYKNYWMAADVLEFTSHGYDGFVFDKDNNQVNFEGYRADCITDFALDYIENHTTDKPFFLFLSHIEPHHQNDRDCYEGPNGSKEKYKDFVVPKDLEGTGGNWEQSYPDYLGCCNQLDKNLGRIRETLEKTGQADNTIIFYLSDHGSHFKTRNSEYKRSCHESSLRIPFIAYGGPFTNGGVKKELVSLIDLPKTILNCAGVDVPKEIQGHDLSSIMDGDHSDELNSVFAQISESHVGRTVRTHKWKYSVNARKDAWQDSGSDTYYEDFLYDLENDPHEKNNLVASEDYTQVRVEMSEILKKHMAQAGEDVPTILPCPVQ